jgi:hypothetical protein
MPDPDTLHIAPLASPPSSPFYLREFPSHFSFVSCASNSPALAHSVHMITADTLSAIETRLLTTQPRLLAIRSPSWTSRKTAFFILTLLERNLRPSLRCPLGLALAHSTATRSSQGIASSCAGFGWFTRSISGWVWKSFRGRPDYPFCLLLRCGTHRVHGMRGVYGRCAGSTNGCWEG